MNNKLMREEAMKAAEEVYEAAFPDVQAIDFNGLHDAFDAYHRALKRYKDSLTTEATCKESLHRINSQHSGKP